MLSPHSRFFPLSSRQPLVLPCLLPGGRAYADPSRHHAEQCADNISFKPHDNPADGILMLISQMRKWRLREATPLGAGGSGIGVQLCLAPVPDPSPIVMIWCHFVSPAHGTETFSRRPAITMCAVKRLHWRCLSLGQSFTGRVTHSGGFRAAVSIQDPHSPYACSLMGRSF